MVEKNNKNTGKNSSLPAMEEEILNFWEKNRIFEKSVKNPPRPQGGKSPLPPFAKGGIKDYVFYDGPPFATGTPHYGHIVASLMKDIVPRYWTMKGFRIERKWGWDCHGLPIENIVEKEMGTKSKKDIEEKGIDKFNEQCCSKVLEYAKDWEKAIRRMGRWVDMKNSYRTMDLDYMESIWWVFKELWNKELIYKDYRSMHICPRCETTLSQSEVAEGYKMVKDLSVIVKFEITNKTPLTPAYRTGRPLLKGGENEAKVYLLAWTTTPWTLIGNVALAIGEDIDYRMVESEGEYYIFANEMLPEIQEKSGKKFKMITKIKSEELIGEKYKPLFDYYTKDKNLENLENGWKVYAADFVTTEEGTGIVHIAPAFGEDDMNLGKDKNLPFIQHVGMDGVIKDEAKDFAGLHVKPADDITATDVEIIKYLAKKGLLFAKEKYEHSYPHCWRCDTPLLNYATSSWFVNITKIKPRMLELAKKINWTPKHIKAGRFGNWLEGARDWSISRQRFWASVIPIWECDKCDKRKVIGSVKELEDLGGEKVDDLHKHIVDKITFACDCGGKMTRVPDVLDCWFESGSMPYAQMHYPFANKEKFEKNFPAEFIAEGIDQTRAWFYYLHAIATGIKDSHAFKNVIANGIVLAEDGKKMAKKLQNYPDPMEVMEKYGADPLRYYLCASPVMKADNINFSEKDMAEQTRFFNILLNVLSFYKMFAVDLKVENLEKKDLVNVLDKWITARLEQTKQIITEKMDNYDLQAIREIPIFINDLSTWYVRRSRDRFKGEDEADKMRALKTLRRTLYHLARIMAPFMPFTAEHIYQELGADVESVHLKEWPEVRKEWIDEKVLQEMEQVRKIVELGLAERDKAVIKVRQPLQKLKAKSEKLKAEYVELIKDELNVKEVEFVEGGELAVELDTEMTPELVAEGIKRELVRTINNLRKETGMTIQDRAVIYYETENKEIREVFEKFGEEIKKDTLADEIRIGGEGKVVKINETEVGLKVEKK
ncbi:MAG: isoleucine--tRNA ligase [Patescibacteria group bacterium]|nr:isoleucine--tRNA ligase [Patescibacteria group bacterium]